MKCEGTKFGKRENYEKTTNIPILSTIIDHLEPILEVVTTVGTDELSNRSYDATGRIEYVGVYHKFLEEKPEKLQRRNSPKQNSNSGPMGESSRAITL